MQICFTETLIFMTHKQEIIGISGFGTPFQYINIDRDQKKPVSTIFIRNLELKLCVFAFTFRNIQY